MQTQIKTRANTMTNLTITVMCIVMCLVTLGTDKTRSGMCVYTVDMVTKRLPW